MLVVSVKLLSFNESPFKFLSVIDVPDTEATASVLPVNSENERLFVIVVPVINSPALNGSPLIVALLVALPLDVRANAICT